MCSRALRSRQRDEGSASVATVGVIAAIALLLSTFLLGGGALLEYVAAQNALSEATLSAAEAAVGEREGYPCTLAAERAKSAGIASVLCLVRSNHVRLVWQVSVLGLNVELKAQAGAD